MGGTRKKISSDNRTISSEMSDGQTDRWDAMLHAVSNGDATLAHPVVQAWIEGVQFSLKIDLITLRRIFPQDQKKQFETKKRIKEYERRLKQIGGTALIKAAQKGTKGISVIRAERTAALMAEATLVFELWKPLRDADNAKKLRTSEEKIAAAEERTRVVANKISEIWGSMIFAHATTPGSAEYYESVHRDFLEPETMEERAKDWVRLFEKSTRTHQACEEAVNKRVAEEFREISKESLDASVRLGRSKLRKKT